MPLTKYSITYKGEMGDTYAEANTLKELAKKTIFSYDVLQKKFRYPTVYNNKKIISIEKEVIEPTRRNKKKYNYPSKYVKIRPQLTYQVIINDETHNFKTLKEGSKIMNIAISTLHNILRSEELKNKHNISIVQ